MRDLLLAGLLLAVPAAAGPIGLFDHQSDIGAVTPAGSASFETGRYTLVSSGANIWGKEDAFHYVWKQTRGDFALTADIAFPPQAYAHEPNPHRKAVLMIRAGLEADVAYVDVAVHGNGLTALQLRRDKGGPSEDIELNIALPKTVRLEKRGDEIAMLISANGEPLHPVGAVVKLHFAEPYYLGLGLTAHDAATTDAASFDNVRLEPPAPRPDKLTTWSTLKVIKIDEGAPVTTLIESKPGIYEAPNWAPDAKSFVINENGSFHRIPILDPMAGGARQPFDAGGLHGCWGEHAFSPDGKWVALSCPATGEHKPDVHLVPVAGGAPIRLTHQPISFFHGWSPDSRTIVFTTILGEHEDIYSVPVAGGEPKRLTREALNDGGEFSADGKFIYFNSNRSGTMQIWRMRADGSEPTQITHDEFDNWYPHVSPDGKWIAILSYAKGEASASHPMNKDVTLRLYSLETGRMRVLTHLVGGQGTFDSPCWSPDSQLISFVSYQDLP